jgi:hypothetical protein
MIVVKFLFNEPKDKDIVLEMDGMENFYNTSR